MSDKCLDEMHVTLHRQISKTKRKRKHKRRKKVMSEMLTKGVKVIRKNKKSIEIEVGIARGKEKKLLIRIIKS
jgi:hypothetical protein